MSIIQPDIEGTHQQQHKAGSLSITFYTDPLCCWSWAMQPALRQLEDEFGNSINWRYCMAGLIPSWNNFVDSINSVNRPLQMGPVWMHASQVAGVEINHSLWYRDPPASSYPACIAFKSVQAQSEDYASIYLKLLWDSCMNRGINISKQEELFKLAARLKEVFPDFDTDQFEEYFTGREGVKALSDDIQETKAKNIDRLPAMILRRTGKPALLITGYKPYDYILDVIQQL